MDLLLAVYHAESVYEPRRVRHGNLRKLTSVQHVGVLCGSSISIIHFCFISLAVSRYAISCSKQIGCGTAVLVGAPGSSCRLLLSKFWLSPIRTQAPNMASLEEPLKVPMHPAAELGLKCFLAGTRLGSSPQSCEQD